MKEAEWGSCKNIMKGKSRSLNSFQLYDLNELYFLYILILITNVTVHEKNSPRKTAQTLSSSRIMINNYVKAVASLDGVVPSSRLW